MNIIQHKVDSDNVTNTLIPEPALTLSDQRKEQRRSIQRKCEAIAKLVPSNRPSVSWVHLNDEGDLLTEIIPNAKQVAGSQSDDEKEELFEAFAAGQIQHLVTKPKIACFGLNWQHCADVFYLPSHSHEAYYQAIRRCWRFGQTNEVNCTLVYSKAESAVAANMLRKEKQSEDLYAGIIKEMNAVQQTKKESTPLQEMKVPSWLS